MSTVVLNTNIILPLDVVLHSACCAAVCFCICSNIFLIVSLDMSRTYRYWIVHHHHLQRAAGSYFEYAKPSLFELDLVRSNNKWNMECVPTFASRNTVKFAVALDVR